MILNSKYLRYIERNRKLAVSDLQEGRHSSGRQAISELEAELAEARKGKVSQKGQRAPLEAPLKRRAGDAPHSAHLNKAKSARYQFEELTGIPVSDPAVEPALPS